MCVKKWHQAIFSVLTHQQITRCKKIIVQLDFYMGMMAWVRSFMRTNPEILARLAVEMRLTYGERTAERYPCAHLEKFLRDSIRNVKLPFGTVTLERNDRGNQINWVGK
ncbi:MAG: hypothetical protein C3F13_13785 [Anaerolineales bacterium]|nr:hypothetical protein [Anaerolineae bacterium]PWB51508.1 MAG: hypothetical protein C3F13_13785 [Anaerolineales bacterium]